jgi:multidrug efflux pump subunit AcrA (membrane-fusion protein)
MNLTSKLIVGVLVVIILAGGIFLFQYFSSLKTLPPERPPVKTITYVKVEEVVYNKLQTKIVAYGRIGSSQPLDIIAEVGGKLLPGQVIFKEGANFSKGQLLFSIYDVESRMNVQARKSQFLNMLANTLPDLKYDFPDNYETWRSYFDQIDIQKELPQHPKPKSAKEKTFLASKNLLSEYYTIKSFEENLKKYKIYAPYNGSIAIVNREIGTVVNPGTNIARIIRTDKLELEVPVEVADIRWVQQGGTVQVTTEDGMNKWIGKIVRIGDYVDPNTQSIKVYISLNSTASNPLYEGLYLKAIIPGKEVPTGLEVPRKVLSNNNRVFVVEQDSLLKSKTVNILKINEDSVIINGLEKGELLVVEAPTNASNNMIVKILNNNSEL